jgi:hypothetical protein
LKVEKTVLVGTVILVRTFLKKKSARPGRKFLNSRRKAPPLCLTWFVDLKGGAFLLEFRNLRPGRADFFFKKVRTKITVPTSTVFSTFKLFNVNGVRSSLVRYTSFKG